MGTREGCRWRWLHLAFGVLFLLVAQGVKCEHEPTESECRPYIVKALKDHHVEDELTDTTSIEQEENPPIDEASETNEDTSSTEQGDADGGTAEPESSGSEEEATTQQDTSDSTETADGEEQNKTDEENDTVEETDKGEQTVDGDTAEETDEEQTAEEIEQVEAAEASEESREAEPESTEESKETTEAGETSLENEAEILETESSQQETTESVETDAEKSSQETQSAETGEVTAEENAEAGEDGDTTTEDTNEEAQEASTETKEEVAAEETESTQTESNEEASDTTESTQESGEGSGAEEVEQSQEEPSQEEPSQEETAESEQQSGEAQPESQEVQADQPAESEKSEEAPTEASAEEPSTSAATEGSEQEAKGTEEVASEEAAQEATDSESAIVSESEEVPEEDLTQETVIPDNLRSRDHITQILRLDEESVGSESALEKTIESTLKTLKASYDNAIKPLEVLYKHRDLSNRHFGDPEIFSKPLVLFMGPWSGGKSSTINYLLNLEFTELALRTGAEPSPAYFNILTYGKETEILDGTQLAADWTFSGLQKFGQGFLDRLRGVRLNNRLLEKVNIVEIPGILEIRKQVQRLFPFNDACQWFIDRADIIFLVYDPAKLDVGPETEAILDQLKGREYQTRIILNKADQVKPEELMRVQGTLIWNISPLMSSQEPPVMYTTSLWSLPYEHHAPARLLLAQERAFLRDLREAIDKRVENKIASARRFAVRVRNHAKMVDCYLTTYYNHKTFFGNKKKVSDDIIENPQKYHIYEGLSTLTNISRYDLPDPEMYKDFFRINPLYEFTKLSDTCTYFRGCPINKLDITIAYDLPELVGKYKKAVEASKPSS